MLFLASILPTTASYGTTGKKFIKYSISEYVIYNLKKLVEFEIINENPWYVVHVTFITLL